ncbi:hypothetical protein CCR80_03625 [Rhodothalassium salexigens]|uniref:gamma-butyrobetaine hydroxylase-like domain-containing protein n=1 Tax=Rhodothalassium salexigens TaxID=1086 RepID=UPI001913DBEC|nr:gamma-butyrobetaine hydroxylase-like domain-containing protein [Rhodothalassium salexigens]MBK5920128.1 hypothetical protein [Rhodothalassium salexigens]
MTDHDARPPGTSSPPKDARQVVDLAYDRTTRRLAIGFADGARFTLGAEFLRVHSPSAEVKGHAGQGGTLVRGKARVAITGLDPVGTYAVKISFDDGHDTGLYSWPYLRDLCENADRYWAEYQAKVSQDRP